MAKSKYSSASKKHFSSFNRRSPRTARAPGNAILIVAEGANTEDIYFNEFKRVFGAPTVEIEVQGVGINDPKRLVEKALELQRKRKKKAKDGELSPNQLPKFDELWIVFDLDVLTHDKLHEGLEHAKMKQVMVAHTHPCIEYWLLLHSEYTTKPFMSCKEVVRHLGWDGYDKSYADTCKWVKPLLKKNLVQDAVTHADRLMKHHISAGTPFPEKPSTKVQDLIRSIHDSLGPANQFLSD